MASHRRGTVDLRFYDSLGRVTVAAEKPGTIGAEETPREERGLRWPLQAQRVLSARLRDRG